MKEITTIEEYRRALALHDWYYMMSDDDSVYRAGRKSIERLQRARESLDPDKAIWNELAPTDFQSPRS